MCIRVHMCMHLPYERGKRLHGERGAHHQEQITFTEVHTHQLKEPARQPKIVSQSVSQSVSQYRPDHRWLIIGG